MEKIKWDKWQKDLISYEGDCIIMGGRQSGKSFAVSKQIAERAKKYPKTKSLIVAASERQESYLFEKVRDWLHEEKALSSKRQTLSKLHLKNGSTIIKHPAGTSGYFLKGMTCDFLYVDEAHYMNERVWDSIMPMIIIARGKGLGWRTYLSTPFGKSGYFYKCWESGKFKKFHINSEECVRMKTKEGKAFLAEEKERMTKAQYAQEYLGEFIDDYLAYFPTNLIKKCMNFKFWDKKITPERKFYLGIDIGGTGKDEEAYCVGEIIGKRVRNIYNETLPTSSMQQTIKKTRWIDNKLNLRKIFIDSGGMGIGYEDIMKEEFSRRLVGLNNSSKSKENKKKILKEDLYSNCKRLMEQGRLDLIEDVDMMKSLQSIQLEDGKISGKKDHLAEALVRMCWSIKEKGLKLFIA